MVVRPDVLVTVVAGGPVGAWAVLATVACEPVVLVAAVVAVAAVAVAAAAAAAARHWGAFPAELSVRWNLPVVCGCFAPTDAATSISSTTVLTTVQHACCPSTAVLPHTCCPSTAVPHACF